MNIWETRYVYILGTFLYKALGLSFQNFCKNGVSDSPHKKKLVDKMIEVVLKKGVPLIFILTNPFQFYLSLSVWCVCLCVCVCVLFIYTISISIPCISWEELSLMESNQQIYDFYKWVVFEKQRQFGTLGSKFLISENYSFSVIWTAAVST